MVARTALLVILVAALNLPAAADPGNGTVTIITIRADYAEITIDDPGGHTSGCAS